MPAHANPLGLQDSDLKWCQAYVGMTADQIRSGQASNSSSSSSSSSGGGLGIQLPIKGIPVGFSGNANSSDSFQRTSSSSSSFNQDKSSLYVAKNCDTLLRVAGDVTIADINANRDIALAKIQSDAYKYGVDAQRAVGLDANYTERYKSDNQLSGSKYHDDAWVKTTEIQSNASTTNTIINTTGGVIGGVLGAIAAANNSPPSPQPSAPSSPAPSVVATAPSDPVSQLLAQWGWIQTICVQGKVFIIGLANGTVCVEPNATVSAGNYRFANNQLYPLTNQNSYTTRQLEENVENDNFSSDSDKFLSDDSDNSDIDETEDDPSVNTDDAELSDSNDF